MQAQHDADLFIALFFFFSPEGENHHDGAWVFVIRQGMKRGAVKTVGTRKSRSRGRLRESEHAETTEVGQSAVT